MSPNGQRSSLTVPVPVPAGDQQVHLSNRRMSKEVLATIFKKRPRATILSTFVSHHSVNRHSPVVLPLKPVNWDSPFNLIIGTPACNTVDNTKTGPQFQHICLPTWPLHFLQSPRDTLIGPKFSILTFFRRTSTDDSSWVRCAGSPI